MKRTTKILHYIQNYKFNSIVVKNFLLIIIILILPLSLMTLLIYQRMNETAIEEISSLNMDALSQTRDVIEGIFYDMDQMAVLMSFDINITSFLASGSTDELLSNQFFNMSEMLNRYSMSYDFIDSIYVFSESSDFFVSGDDGGKIVHSVDSDWYLDYPPEEQENEPWIVPRLKYGIFPYLISMIRPLPSNEKRQGAIMVNIDMINLGKLIQRDHRDSMAKVLVIDSKNRIIFSNNRLDFLQDFSGTEIYGLLPNTTEEFSSIITLSDREYIVSVLKSRFREYRFISLLPMETYGKKLDGVKNFIIVLMLFSIAFALILSGLISVRTFGPVLNILSIFESPEKLNSSQQAYFTERNDEVKFIAQNIIQTIYSNQHLKEELDEQFQRLYQAQAIALQAQINPHFLYNTLDTIRWLVLEQTNGENEASQMISSLSKLLRISFDSSDRLITISEELEHVRLYLDIMLIRYGEKMKILWDIKKKTNELKTAKLIIQPIVENSIYHGIKKLKSDGLIRISTDLIDDTVEITVEDNGPGLSDQQLDDLKHSLAEQTDIVCQHIGLANVNQRIRITMGQDYGLVLNHSPLGGVLVTIRLPLMR